MVLNTPRFPKSRGIVFCLNFWYYLSIKYKEDFMGDTIVSLDFSFEEVETILIKAKDNQRNGKIQINSDKWEYVKFKKVYNITDEEILQIFLNLEVYDFNGCNIIQKKEDEDFIYLDNKMYVFTPRKFFRNGIEETLIIYVKFAFDKNDGDKTVLISIHPADRPMPYLFKRP